MYWNGKELEYAKEKNKININMRCIEINPNRLYIGYCRWLTLTWDVLKCLCKCRKTLLGIWLTLTWDVLKFSSLIDSDKCGLD